MTSSREGFSDRLSFSQRYGYEPRPEPMRLDPNKHRQAGGQDPDGR